jgi:hypothetical protein
MLFLPLRPEFEAAIDDDFDWDSDPRWLCRFIDSLSCPECGTCDLTVSNPSAFLGCDGPHLPVSPAACRACGSSCHGPLAFECYGVPGQPLAFLGPQYGGPLVGRLCGACHLVWLSLHPDDAEGRRELAARFPDGGTCDQCGRGRLRATRVDVPHAGYGGLYDPSQPTGQYGGPAWVADLLIVVCDSCGEATARAGWPEQKHAEPSAAADPARKAGPGS